MKKNIILAVIMSVITGSAVLYASVSMSQKCKKARKSCCKKKKEVSWEKMVTMTIVSGLIRALSKLLADQVEKKAGVK